MDDKLFKKNSSEMLVAMIMSLEDMDIKDKLQEQSRLIDILKGREMTINQARDREYVMVDDDLDEGSRNFFVEELELFTSSGILDDDDLEELDNILKDRLKRNY